jgi:hypothetical protein
MEDDFGEVTVWVGLFPSEERLDAYFHETYRDDDVEEPISDFARDQHQWFYDHDFVERSFHEPTTDVRELLRHHSFSSSFGAAAEQRARELSQSARNVVVLVWNREVCSPRSVRGCDYDLELLGTFPCDPDAPAL